MTDRSFSDMRGGWAAARTAMEAGTRKHTPRGVHRRRQWPLFEAALAGFGVALRLTGLYRRGVMNALDIALTEIELEFSDLPAPFDGYRVLHLADLHLDAHPALAKRAAALARRAQCDLCVLTGDYRYRIVGPIDRAMAGLARVARAIDARDGVYGVLGNHDTIEMVPALEALGIRVLANQTVSVARDGATLLFTGMLHITGIDDVHYFYTGNAAAALVRAPDGFRLAVVHSPELVQPAADSGIALYLTGHTHGGQICLPGGFPPVIHAHRGRRYAAGLWRHGDMVGYTSRGVGVSGLPVRFNCRGEIALITLRRAGG
jgi:predicted MPP superfamily phosphohydrolase